MIFKKMKSKEEQIKQLQTWRVKYKIYGHEISDSELLLISDKIDELNESEFEIQGYYTFESYIKNEFKSKKDLEKLMDAAIKDYLNFATIGIRDTKSNENIILDIHNGMKLNCGMYLVIR